MAGSRRRSSDRQKILCMAAYTAQSAAAKDATQYTTS